jgi:hypothetical protein
MAKTAPCKVCYQAVQTQATTANIKDIFRDEMAIYIRDISDNNQLHFPNKLNVPIHI